MASNTRPVPSQSVGVSRNSLGVSRCPGTRISERRHLLQEPSSRTRRSSCDIVHRHRRHSLDSDSCLESNLEFVPRPRRSSLDSQASLETGSRHRRESGTSGEINYHWRQFLQRNREFALNKEKALENKRKAKKDELDKACTFAPQVHEWNLKIEEGDGETCSTESSTSRSEIARPKASQSEIETCANESKSEVGQQLVSISIQEDLDGNPRSTVDCLMISEGADTRGTCFTGSKCLGVQSSTEKSQAEAITELQEAETLPASRLPLEAWNEEQEVTVAEGHQGPARLSCSPSGKLIVSNLASEVTLHDAWPRAKLLFADCDDVCDKKLPNAVSATASTEVSNCSSEAGGPDNEEDDLDTLIANLRSHKVYSFHFSG